MGKEFCWPYNRPVCVNRVLIEPDAGQEALQGRVAVPVNELAIEAATRFIDNVVTNGAHIRTGEGMGAPLLLSQAESGKWRSDGRIPATECLLVQDPVHMISIRKVMIDAKGSQVSGREAGHQGLK